MALIVLVVIMVAAVAALGSRSHGAAATMARSVATGSATTSPAPAARPGAADDAGAAGAPTADMVPLLAAASGAVSGQGTAQSAARLVSAAATASGSLGGRPAGDEAPRTGEPGDVYRSGIQGTNTWTTAKPVHVDRSRGGTVRTFMLRIEKGTNIDPQAAAREVSRVLGDPRSWRGSPDHVSFRQVSRRADADFVLSIATPTTVDRLCRPSQTESRWSCRNGNDVALNSDRFSFGSPTYPTMSSYREYLINHEVGHWVGHGHDRCPGKGRRATIMVQQSHSLHGCRPGGWPAPDAATS